MTSTNFLGPIAFWRSTQMEHGTLDPAEGRSMSLLALGR